MALRASLETCPPVTPQGAQEAMARPLDYGRRAPGRAAVRGRDPRGDAQGRRALTRSGPPISRRAAPDRVLEGRRRDRPPRRAASVGEIEGRKPRDPAGELLPSVICSAVKRRLSEILSFRPEPPDQHTTGRTARPVASPPGPIPSPRTGSRERRPWPRAPRRIAPASHAPAGCSDRTARRSRPRPEPAAQAGRERRPRADTPQGVAAGWPRASRSSPAPMRPRTGAPVSSV